MKKASKFLRPHSSWLPDKGKYPNFSIELILGLNKAKNGNRWVMVY
jgi:hypothetical protein